MRPEGMGGGGFVQAKALILIASNWAFAGLQELRNGGFCADLSPRNCDKKTLNSFDFDCAVERKRGSSQRFGKIFTTSQKIIAQSGGQNEFLLLTECCFSQEDATFGL
ncbi:MAG: hypothetical protein ACK6DQ_18970 [Planctomycetota bacterium]